MDLQLQPVAKEQDWRNEHYEAAPERSVALGCLSHIEARPNGYNYYSWDEFMAEGRSIYWEVDAGMMQYHCEQMLPREEIGWWFFDGLTAHYSKSYEGEHDCDIDCENIRPARWSDLKYFGVKIPRWVRLLLWLRFDGDVPASYWPAD